MNDDESLFNFQENEIIIPSIVWEELNDNKDNHNDGYIPRRILRLLTELSEIRPLREGIRLKELPETSKYYKMAKDLDTLIRVDYKIWNDTIKESFVMRKHDYHVMACALNNDAILITMDIGLLGIARDFVKAEEHKAEEIKSKEIFKGYRFVKVSGTLIDEFYSNKTMEDKWGLYPNEFIVLEDEIFKEHTAVGIKKKGLIKVCLFDKELNFSKMRTRPINLEQKMMLYLLQDPEILCVSVTGMSGRGKSLVCTDFAFTEVDKNVYSKFLYTKSIIPVDESEYMGFYRGGPDEKFTPHLQPLFSCIEFLYRDDLYRTKNSNGNGRYKEGCDEPMTVEKKFEELRDIGKLGIVPLAEIRGMNIFNKIVMLDEAQNTKKHMIKTLVTRLTDESKLIVTGDIEQIDDPKLSMLNNGLSHLIEQGKTEEFIAHISLDIDKGNSKRGKLATFGAKKL